jgi:uncharacterized protein YunC (DUF1805 family)
MLLTETTMSGSRLVYGLAVCSLILSGCGSPVRDTPRAEDGRADKPAPATVLASSTVDEQDSQGDFWKGLERHEIQLEQTLLLVKGSRGIAACPYLNIDMFAKTDEACVIIPAAKTAGMLDSRVTAVTPKAKELGITVGMSGREALDKIR